LCLKSGPLIVSEGCGASGRAPGLGGQHQGVPSCVWGLCPSPDSGGGPNAFPEARRVPASSWAARGGGGQAPVGSGRARGASLPPGPARHRAPASGRLSTPARATRRDPLPTHPPPRRAALRLDLRGSEVHYLTLNRNTKLVTFIKKTGI